MAVPESEGSVKELAGAFLIGIFGLLSRTGGDIGRGQALLLFLLVDKGSLDFLIFISLSEMGRDLIIKAIVFELNFFGALFPRNINGFHKNKVIPVVFELAR